MALRCAIVIRGISKPELVELISSFEEALGVVVPMPIFWALQHKMNADNSSVKQNRIKLILP